MGFTVVARYDDCQWVLRDPRLGKGEIGPVWETYGLTKEEWTARFGAIEARFSHGLATMIMPWIVGNHCRELIYTGDMFDAREALRIGLVNQVVPKAQLLEECFKYVERIALVPPETVKINLHIANMGLEMMGLRKAWALNAELSAMARLSKEEEFGARLEEAKKKGGLKAFFETRDAPFKPEPFGPRAQKR